MSEDGENKTASGVQAFKMTYELKGSVAAGEEDEDFKNYDPNTKDNKIETH